MSYLEEDIRKLIYRYERHLERALDRKKELLNKKELSEAGNKNLGFYEGLDYAYGNIIDELKIIIEEEV